ncbi:MAG: GatB/YqeY domain-containing protein [Clostridia bacterium]|nr:GatB/YqeY domain-containing protein [Clostridia bacterium]
MEGMIVMLKEKLLEDLKTSMKEKNVNRKNTVQMVRAAILQVEKDKKIELNDDQILEVIAKEFKKRNDSLADYEKSGREDLISQIKEEMSVLEEYLPKKLSEEELTEKVKEIIAEVGATSMKDMGIVMKTAKEKLGVTADGRMINEVVKKILA